MQPATSLIWLALLFALILGYSYRSDFRDAWQRVTGELNPATPIERTGGEVVLRRPKTAISMPTSASTARPSACWSTPAPPRSRSAPKTRPAPASTSTRLNFDDVRIDSERHGAAAKVELKEVRVGSIVRRNVRASVQRNLGDSLLGMSFLDQLIKYSSEADRNGPRGLTPCPAHCF